MDRALAILETLAAEPEGLRLGEIAAATGLAASTAHRLLTALQQRGFAQVADTRGLWHVGRKAFRVGAAFVQRKAFAAPATPLMRTLRNATSETVNLGEPDDGRIVIIAQVESREVVRVINVLGGSAPLSTSALGKAVLASYDDAALAAHIARHGLPRATGRSLVDARALRADLGQTRERGYALDCEEHVAGLHCIAAPVFDRAGDAVAALSVSGLAGRMASDRIARMAVHVVAAAAELTRNLGGQAPAKWVRA